MDRLDRLRGVAIAFAPARLRVTHTVRDPTKLKAIGEVTLTPPILCLEKSGAALGTNPSGNMLTSKFTKLRKILGPKFGSKKIATAEKEASENPKKFLKKMKEPNIKKLKGIAL